MHTVIVRERSTGEPRNPHYEQDIHYVLKHPRWILRSLGIWPTFLEDGSRVHPNIVIGLCNLILLFVVVPFHLYISLEEKSVTIKVKHMGLLTFCTVSLLKYWTLVACKSRLKHCVENVKNDWKQVDSHENRELMLKYANVGRKLTMCCMGFMYSGGFMYHMVMQFTGGFRANEQNLTIKPLVYPAYSGIYNPQKSPVYEMLCVAHCMCGYVTHSATVAVCGLAATFATHVCGQIDVMMLRLENLVDFEDKTEIDRGLMEIVEHHMRMLRFSAAVEALLQEICFFEFIGSTVNICLVENNLLMEWGTSTFTVVTFITLLISLMFNIFILCYIGDILAEKTGKVGISCFMINWYKFPNDTIRGLILIIVRSNNPAKITAGQLVVLNMSTFASIVKTSLGYLSLLRTVV